MNEPTEREWLEGLRYEDKFPEAGDGGRVPERWDAPWTDEQIAALAEYQASGRFHPYTCGADSSHGPLTPTRDGWVCESCPYSQGWAHAHGDARGDNNGRCRTCGDWIGPDGCERCARDIYDPASVLAALLAESPDATVAAIEALLTSDEAVEAARVACTGVACRPCGVCARDALSAACRSLLSKAPKEDRDA